MVRARLVEDRVGVALDAALGVDQQHDDVGVLGAAPGGGHHRLVEPALGLEDARRVDEDDLRGAVGGDAAHDGARRLHLVGDDRDLGADEPVDQRRLAGIGRADQRDEAGACRRASPRQSPVVLRSRCHVSLRSSTPSRVRKSRRRPLVRPPVSNGRWRVAAANTRHSSTATVKTGSWSGTVAASIDIVRPARRSCLHGPFLQLGLGIARHLRRRRASAAPSSAG